MSVVGSYAGTVPRFSVVIPTFQRRAVIVRNVATLDRQAFRDFEVVVVVDGSTDGTSEALRALDVDFPLTIIDQPNSGSAEARNVGAARARGELVLFMDDDMEADPALLVHHDRAHRNGADVVIGHLPLHPRSPRSVLSWGVGFWADARRTRLVAAAGALPLSEILTGQLSIPRRTFTDLAGFDGAFTRAGLYGGEDVDFGYRVIKAGLRVVFDPDAVSHQYYDVDPADYLRRAFEAGRAEQELLTKHPEQAEELGRGPSFHTRRSRWTLGPLVFAPVIVSRPVRAAAAALVRTGRRGHRIRRLFWAVRTMEHLRGARSARRRMGRGRVVVLAYHAIADLHQDPLLRAYGVTPALLESQLDALRDSGWTFVDMETVLGALRGEARLPRRAVLVTFDDAYDSVIRGGVPVLAARDIPAVIFAVAAHVGLTNAWDDSIGASKLRLMDAAQLLEASAAGIEIGCHSATHRELPRLAATELPAELQTAAEDLERLGLPRPRVFAYPYGEHDDTTRRAVRDAGYAAAFTVTPGVVDRSTHRWTMPRIEVLADDTPLMLLVKVHTAAWAPAWRRRALSLAAPLLKPALERIWMPLRRAHRAPPGSTSCGVALDARPSDRSPPTGSATQH